MNGEISEELVQKAVSGDLDAFEDIYRLSSALVYRTALSVVRNPADAEEVMQDVFMKVYHHLKAFKWDASVKTWIYRITMNTAINYYRKNARERNRRSDFDKAVMTEQVPSEAGKGLDQEAYKESVFQLLECLNPDQRACIVLREIEGMDYQQIADVLGINLNTVRSRLKRGREALLNHAKKGGVSYGL